MFKNTFRYLFLILLLCVSCTKENERGEFVRHYELVVTVKTTVQNDMFKYPCSAVFWTFIHNQNIQLESQKIVYELTTDIDPSDRQSVYAKGLNDFVIDRYENHLNPGLAQARMLVEKSIALTKAEVSRLKSLKGNLEPGFKPYAEYKIQIICKNLDKVLSDYAIYTEYGENNSWIVEDVEDMNL